MSVCNSELLQPVFQHSKDKEMSSFLSVVLILLCEGWGGGGRREALLGRNSRTALQYGERRGSITPPDKEKKNNTAKNSAMSSQSGTFLPCGTPPSEGAM